MARRQAEPALRRGALRFLDAPPSILAFERAHGGDILTCVFNLGHETEAWTLDGRFAVIQSVSLDDAAPTGLPPLAGGIGRRLAI